MLSAYRHLLRLYPAAYRSEFGQEMCGVFCELQQEAKEKGWSMHCAFVLRECFGLLTGAIEEHLRTLGATTFCPTFFPRSVTMRSSFRFPNSTAALMAVILAGIILAIQQARSVAAAATGRQKPTLLAMFVLMFGASCIVAAIGWVALFALRRSGVHRLAQMPELGHGNIHQ